VCSYYEVLFKEDAHPPLKEEIVPRAPHGSNIFVEFQGGILFPNYNYPPPPSDAPKPMKKKKKGKEPRIGREKQFGETPEVQVPEEEAEDPKAALKARVQKASRSGKQSEGVSKPGGTSKPGEVPVSAMEAVLKEMSAKQVKILVSKVSGSEDWVLLSPKCRKKTPSLSESLERQKKRKLEAGGSGRCYLVLNYLYF
jgi:hypothetical protein